MLEEARDGIRRHEGDEGEQDAPTQRRPIEQTDPARVPRHNEARNEHHFREVRFE
jgi:uncharacterized protein (UPF0297 family)